LSNKALPKEAFPDLPDRSRLSVSLIGRTLSSQKSGEHYRAVRRSRAEQSGQLGAPSWIEKLRPDQDGRIDRAATRSIDAIRAGDEDDQHGRCWRECGADVGFGVTSS
jgi:hypothetical protein